MLRVLIIYATVGGNTELVVNQVKNKLQDLDLEVQTKRVDVTQPVEILDFELTILASPTYGQGVLESHFLPFIKAWNKVNTADKYMTAIGLGSMTYYPEYLTEATTLLEAEITQRAKLLLSGLRISGDPLRLLNSLVLKWSEKTALQLKTQFN